MPARIRPLPSFWFEPNLWIDGCWVTAPDVLEVVNPATGQMLSEVALAGEAETISAIEGAQRAGRDWASRSAADRGEILARAAQLLSERRDVFACLLSAEQGKPYHQAAGEVDYAASFLRWYGEEARRLKGQVLPHPEVGREFIVESFPIGVAGLITPWNFPLAQGAKKIAAALAAGCSAVWKPSELTPLIALGLAPLLQEAGIPDGVVQVVPGMGPVVGGVLASHPAVGVLSLTGATDTGAALLRATAGGIKRVLLELGGNAPFLILPDADLDFVADDLLQSKLFVSGQVCITANRILVPQSLEAPLASLLAEKLQTMRVGNGLEEGSGVDAGPLIHSGACSRVSALVREALAAGAELVAENHSFQEDSALRGGSFFPPTILKGVTDEMKLSAEEIFGPVVPLLSYQSVDEAIRRANETRHGLAAYVYGEDLSCCRAVASMLEVGIVGINEWRPVKAEIPFGGVKQSGIGREGGEEGLREFLETRVISTPRPSIRDIGS